MHKIKKYTTGLLHNSLYSYTDKVQIIHFIKVSLAVHTMLQTY